MVRVVSSLWGLEHLIYVECLEQCLAHIKHIVSICLDNDEDDDDKDKDDE